MHYVHTQLPCDLGLTCQDRFDICESFEDEVPFWKLFERVIKTPITTVDGLIDILETIAISLRGTAGTDYHFLRESFSQYWNHQVTKFFVDVWPVLRGLALELPTLFLSGRLDCLTQLHKRVVLSRRQVACLLVHQFLCTLSTPQWMTDGSPDFHIWYSSATPHPKAVKAYLFSLFQYFKLLAEPSDASPLRHSIDDWPIALELRTVEMDSQNLELNQTTSRLIDLEIFDVTQTSSQKHDEKLMGLPMGASVISANKDVGFGRTASQEEMVVGCSPELCAVVIFQPTLQDEEVLIVEGAQAMIAMTGYAREAQFGRYLESGYDCSNWRQSYWRNRTVLFMDALELDNYDSNALIPDVLPGNVDRELRKAYTAFSSLATGTQENLKSVVTGLWGCRSFGGNKEIKTLIQWAAASMAGVKLLFVCPGSDKADFKHDLEVLVNKSLECRSSVEQISKFLHSLQPHDEAAKTAFRSFRLELVRHQT
ncbi:poly(ADP-ribose) glycohydrolase [Physcia stellaris]|nr:poly(ADP-ribose) glycohydrolase [Physcia stellaris]